MAHTQIKPPQQRKAGAKRNHVKHAERSSAGSILNAIHDIKDIFWEKQP